MSWSDLERVRDLDAGVEIAAGAPSAAVGRPAAPYGADGGASAGVDTRHSVGAVSDAVRSARTFSRVALFFGYHQSAIVRLSSIGDRCHTRRDRTSITVITNSLGINCGRQCHLQTSYNNSCNYVKN